MVRHARRGARFVAVGCCLLALAACAPPAAEPSAVTPSPAGSTSTGAPAPIATRSADLPPVTVPDATDVDQVRAFPTGPDGAVQAFTSAVRLFTATPLQQRQTVAYRLYGHEGAPPTGPDAMPVGLDLGVAVETDWQRLDVTGGRYRVVSESDAAVMLEVQLRPVVAGVRRAPIWIGGVMVHRADTGWVVSTVQRRADPDTDSPTGLLLNGTP